MIHIAVCDDNLNDLKKLTQLVKQSPLTSITLHEFNDPNQCLTSIQNGMRYDFFLLDILMNEDNGIDIAKVIRETHHDAPLFFITSTIEFALQGYEVNASRYYLKPIEEERFLHDLNMTLKQIEKSKNACITINNQEGLTKIQLSDIYYIESMLRTIIIHTKTHQYQMIGKISELEEQLKDEDFVRVHKSFLVNLKYIKNIFKDTITLDNNMTILLSKHRSKQTHERLMSYIHNHL